MDDRLRLIEDYRRDADAALPPKLGWRDMVGLAWRTWPYTRPLLPHLLVLLAFTFGGGLIALVTGFVGVDLFTNKVLLGEKLQPIQALVLFVGEDYVTTDPQQLGQAADAAESAAETDADAEAKAPELSEEQRRTVRNRLILWGIFGGVFGGIIAMGLWYYSTWVWQGINQNLRVAMVERVESLSLKFHDDARVGDAIFRVYQDSAMIVNLLLSGIISPLTTLYGIIVGLFIVMAFDPLFALLVIAFSVPIGWLIVASTSRIRRRALANRLANSNLTSGVQEVFAAIKVVKANRAEARVFDQFHEDSTGALNAAYFLRLDMALVTMAVAVLGGSLLLLSEYVMVSWAIESRETFLGALVVSFIGFSVWNYGSLLIARGRVAGLSWQARDILGIWMQMQDLFIALGRAFHLLDQTPDVLDPANPVPFPKPIEAVAWRGVDFSYGDDQAVLRGVDLVAAAGTVTAIVGTTGAGKSTLMSLLLRLYDPGAGRVEVNGTSLTAMAVDDLRGNVAIALQKNVLFADTVANNIRFGTPKATRAMVEEAARIACVDDFVGTMAKGYDTELGERGGKLSAGQRQRLSIARAIVRDTPVLILDEPTASLDARTEQRVLANLAEWGRGRVIFLITHRLSTIRNADRIALLENGRIVEQGRHEDLMAANGRYRAFVGAEIGVAAGGG